jgi:hypothetical protein
MEARNVCHHLRRVVRCVGDVVDGAQRVWREIRQEAKETFAAVSSEDETRQ